LKILLTGKNGQVGRELATRLAALGDVIACDRAMLDLAKPDSIAKVIREHRPGLIVNAAAYTAVDKAESESEAAFGINQTAPGILADEARRIGAMLVHYSTDYVFDGAKPEPYTEEDSPNPINLYGRSKLGGEKAIRASGCRHLIFRTSWVFGPHGANFMLTMLRLGKDRDEIKVVDDQFGAPTSSRLIAEVTTAALQDGRPEGLFNLTAAGRTSWFGFASEIIKAADLKARVMPIPCALYPTVARRPLNSSLDCSKLSDSLRLELPAWQEGLHACLRAMDER